MTAAMETALNPSSDGIRFDKSLALSVWFSRFASQPESADVELIERLTTGFCSRNSPNGAHAVASNYPFLVPGSFAGSPIVTPQNAPQASPPKELASAPPG